MSRGKPKFIPIVIIVASIMFTLKLMVIAEEGKEFFDSSFSRTIHAAESKEPEKKEEEPKAHGEAAEKTEGKEGEVKEADASSEKTTPQSPPSNLPPPAEFSPSQVDILQSLTRRKAELDSYSAELANREKLLHTAEARLEIKFAALKDLKQEVQAILEEYNVKQNANIESLVKIYQTMKPKDAAKIFEGLDMEILLAVIDHMKEAKVAPILAQMNPQKAKEITMQFARQKSIVNKDMGAAK